MEKRPSIVCSFLTVIAHNRLLFKSKKNFHAHNTRRRFLGSRSCRPHPPPLRPIVFCFLCGSTITKTFSHQFSTDWKKPKNGHKKKQNSKTHQVFECHAFIESQPKNETARKESGGFRSQDAGQAFYTICVAQDTVVETPKSPSGDAFLILTIRTKAKRNGKGKKYRYAVCLFQLATVWIQQKSIPRDLHMSQQKLSPQLLSHFSFAAGTELSSQLSDNVANGNFPLLDNTKGVPSQEKTESISRVAKAIVKNKYRVFKLTCRTPKELRAHNVKLITTTTDLSTGRQKTFQIQPLQTYKFSCKMSFVNKRTSGPDLHLKTGNQTQCVSQHVPLHRHDDLLE